MNEPLTTAPTQRAAEPTAGFHPFTLNASQESTLSPQSAAFIQKSGYLVMPAEAPLSAEMIIAGRDAFNASEAVVEDAIIQQFGLSLESITIAGVSVLVISPKTITPGYEDVIAFNTHGGGFTMGTARDRSALLVAGTLGVRVYSVEYTLAPEAKYPVAINQCLAVYQELVTRPNAQRIVSVSSSSGGQLMLALLLRAHEQGLPLPQAQVLFTPGADVSGAGDSFTANDYRDLVTKALSERSVKAFYLGEADAKDPLVSPLYAEFPASFPASVIVTGTRDLLLSNGVRLYWKLKAAGVKTELAVGEGQWHGFHWEYESPESIAAMQVVRQFVAEQLHQ